MGYEEWSIVQLRGWCVDAILLFFCWFASHFMTISSKMIALFAVQFSFFVRWMDGSVLKRSLLSFVIQWHDGRKKPYHQRPLIMNSNFNGIGAKIHWGVYLFNELSFSCHFSSVSWMRDREKNSSNGMNTMIDDKSLTMAGMNAARAKKRSRCTATDDRYERNWLKQAANEEHQMCKSNSAKKQACNDWFDNPDSNKKNDIHEMKKILSTCMALKGEGIQLRDSSKSLRKRVQLGNVVAFVLLFVYTTEMYTHQIDDVCAWKTIIKHWTIAIEKPT